MCKGMIVNYIILAVAIVLLILGFYLPSAFEKKNQFVNLLGKVYIGAGVIFLIVSGLLFMG